MRRRWLILLLALLPVAAMSQEMLVPAATGHRVPPRKQQPAAVRLPFFDDFSNYSGVPDPLLWDTGGASVGTGYGTLPPTVGMMSLDALDANGRLYPQAASSLFPADTVTSLPIRLDSLTPEDSVVFSFYYLPGGGHGNLWERVGDAPDARDSLFLDFYMVTDSAWHTVWSQGGVSEDTLLARTGYSWQYVSLPLTDSGCFDSLFRFRFRNYCSLEDNGKPGIVCNSDQWNIDYVLLDRGRSIATPVFRDVAFVEPAPTMLAHYRAMPARQYRQSDMTTAIKMTIGNLYSSDLATRYTYSVLADDSTELYSYDGGYENAPPFLPGGRYQTSAAHATPPIGFRFDEGTAARRYTVVHTVREGTGGDWRQQNDTVRFEQVFDNYYAYDDGSAENGYGLTSTASRVYLAYRFDLNVADVLTAVDLCFNHTLDGENEEVMFLLTVWQAAADGTPGEVLYRDEERRRTQIGGYQHYELEHETTVSGSIFVGFEQIGNDFINLGFDRSFNTADRIYYLTSTQWQPSILSGSLMIRPCFGESALQGIDRSTQEVPLTVFPNPATSSARVCGLTPGSEVTVYDMQGRRLISARADGTGDMQLSVEDMPDGLCLLRAVSPEGRVTAAKLIIRH